MLNLDLIGKIISHVQFVYDYVQIYFDDDSILSIYNSCNLGKREVPCVIGRRIASIDCTKGTSIKFTVDCTFVISVDLRDESYRSPEALQYLLADGRRIVI